MNRDGPLRHVFAVFCVKRRATRLVWSGVVRWFSARFYHGFCQLDKFGSSRKQSCWRMDCLGYKATEEEENGDLFIDDSIDDESDDGD